MTSMIMKQGQDFYDVTARVLTGLCDVLREAKPDVILVYGDTTTSTAAALVMFYQQILVGHVEAGLRTHNIYSSWPDEMNCQITSCIVTYHFTPILLSCQNLLAEGVDLCKSLGREDAFGAIDPTLLLSKEDYSEISVVNSDNSEYLFLYLLGNEMDFDVSKYLCLD